MAIFDRPLFIFEMANNHQGSVEHGRKIIREMKRVSSPYEEYFNFAVKFQYRDLDTFIHPAYRERVDIKNVRRFKETRLSAEEFLELKQEAEALGMYAVCTPFDEISADRVAQQGYSAVKIASCSFTDWPLLERIAQKNLPVIASTAGSSAEDIDRVASFFQHRGIELALMHCVAQYPTREESLQLNQITFLKERYPQLRVGFSTHEAPGDQESVKLTSAMAIAKGAVIFEKHVGVPAEGVALNGYSATPEQVEAWLAAALKACKLCGAAGTRYTPEPKELQDLQALQRGVFAARPLNAGDQISDEDIFLAFPCKEGQLLAGHLTKYNRIRQRTKLAGQEPVMLRDLEITNNMARVYVIVAKVLTILKKSNIVIPVNATCELSHHYGLEEFERTGVTMIDCINREYCKKILILLPGQSHPAHYHKQKEETFSVVYGSLDLVCNGEPRQVERGESAVVERGVNHSFSSREGCVFEEISTTHYADDSFYEKAEEFTYPRKTKIYITKEMLDNLRLEK